MWACLYHSQPEPKRAAKPWTNRASARYDDQSFAVRAESAKLVIAVHLVHLPAGRFQQELQLEAGEPAQLQLDHAAPEVAAFVLFVVEEQQLIDLLRRHRSAKHEFRDRPPCLRIWLGQIVDELLALLVRSAEIAVGHIEHKSPIVRNVLARSAERRELVGAPEQQAEAIQAQDDRAELRAEL